ncbi:MAG: hypothetical protein ABFS86_11565 [Planctomycetota bacterium]
MTEQIDMEIAGSLERQWTVVDHLVAYLKAAFIYPENNRRVLNSADDLIDQVQDGDMSVVHVVGKEIRVNGEATELPPLLNDWLREVFYKARLAGVELRSDLGRETLALFGRLLQEAGREDDADFTATWPTDRPGLVPLDLMFRGYHRAGSEGATRDDRTADVLFGGGPMLTEPLAPESEQNKVAEFLSTDESVRERLNELRSRWGEVAGSEAEAARVDLVSEISRLLPVEAMRSEDRARELIHHVLDMLDDYRPGDGTMPGDAAGAEESDLSGAALSVARRFFDHRLPVHDITHRDHLPAGRPGDEVVTDDLDALLVEYEALPDATGISFPVDDESLSGELLGIYLHRLISEEDSRVSELMGEMLDDLTDTKIGVLTSYLEPCVSGDVEAARNSPEWKILEILRNQGRLDLLRRAGLLDEKLAAALFPELFDLFLDTLSPDDEEDRNRLRRAVQMIGTERIRAATPVLVGEMQILSPSRSRMVLAADSPEIVPLVGVFAENSDVDARKEIALLLRRLEPPMAESAALRAVNPPDLLPAGYLRDLCQVDWGAPNEKLREYSRYLLMKYITDTAGDSSLTERRVYAIRSLIHLPGPQTVEFLRELAAKGRLLLVSKSARTIRNAVVRTLEEVESV